MTHSFSIHTLSASTRSRQKLSALLLAGASLLPSVASAECTLSGAGTAASPYLVGTYSDLKQLSATFGCDLSKTYLLTADIDASASKGENGAWGFAPIGDSAKGYFSGVFHGAGHSINHLYIVDSSKAGQVTSKNVGLFDHVAGKVDHLVLVDVHVEGRSIGQNVGSIAGFNEGFIDSCNVTGGYVGLPVHNPSLIPYNSSGAVGGVAGSTVGGRIRSCQASDSVIGPDNVYVGGIAGYSGGIIRFCHFSGYIFGGKKSYISGIAGCASSGYMTIDSSSVSGTIQGDSSAYVGGISGYVGAYSIISRCYANVHASAGKGSWIGGIVGYGIGTLNNCYALGSVSAVDSSTIGGLAGEWESGTPIRTSYSLVSVGGAYPSLRGQIAGYAARAEALHWYSYWNTKNEGPKVSIGKLDVFADTVTAFGLTDSLMMVQSSFYAFSFAKDSAWIMVPNSYPLLRGMENATAPGFGALPTGIKPIVKGSWSLRWVGHVAKLELNEPAHVRMVDLQGRIVLPESRFAAGIHELSVPRSNAMMFAQVRTEKSIKTLPLSPLN